MLRVDNFRGMNDVTTKSKSMDEPDIILNAHVMTDGALEKREGCEKITDLPGAHSLWTDKAGTVLCMAEGCLYRIRDREASLIVDTGQPDAQTGYLALSGHIYVSNAYFTGMYDPAAGTIEPWGVPLPAAPVVVPVSGGLPAGTYHLCFTVPGPHGRPSGNGNLTSIVLPENGGISISNLPTGGSVWMTDPNGSQLYFAGTGSVITELPDSPEPLPTMWGSPPLPMSCLCYAHGRVFGARGSRVYYSEPFQPELFRLKDAFLEMNDLVGMIAKTAGGLYVGCRKKTFFFSGKNPIEMFQMPVGEGVVPGSLCYASSLSNLGRNVPVWLGPGGVFAGTSDGQVVNLVKERVKVDPEQDRGASIYRVKDGQTRMLFSYKQKGQNIGIGDNATCEVIRNGSVIA